MKDNTITFLYSLLKPFSFYSFQNITAPEAAQCFYQGMYTFKHNWMMMMIMGSLNSNLELVILHVIFKEMYEMIQ